MSLRVGVAEQSGRRDAFQVSEKEKDGAIHPYGHGKVAVLPLGMKL